MPKYKRDLVQKLKILRQELSQHQPQAGHCRIEVSREEIFEVRGTEKLCWICTLSIVKDSIHVKIQFYFFFCAFLFFHSRRNRKN